MNRIATLLAASEYLKGASPRSRAALADASRVVDLRKRDVLFREGEPGTSLFLQISGRVGMMKAGADGQSTCLKIIGPGELFAVVVLFGSPYPVTAEALDDAVVLDLPGAAFRKLLDETAFRDRFIATLMERQRYLAEQVRRLALDPVERRFLAFLRDHYGERDEIAPALTKKDMAAAIGVTPETFSRLLRRFAREKAVTWSDGRIRVSRSAWTWLHAP